MHPAFWELAVVKRAEQVADALIAVDSANRDLVNR